MLEKTIISRLLCRFVQKKTMYSDFYLQWKRLPWVAQMSLKTGEFPQVFALLIRWRYFFRLFQSAEHSPIMFPLNVTTMNDESLQPWHRTTVCTDILWEFTTNLSIVYTCSVIQNYISTLLYLFCISCHMDNAILGITRQLVCMALMFAIVQQMLINLGLQILIGPMVAKD